MNTPKTESFQDVLNGDKPVLVDFYAEWCGPCKMMAPALKQLAERQGDKLRVLKVDIDRSRAAAEKYQIQSVPTLMLFKEGRVIWRKSGAHSLAQLEQLVRPYVG